MPRPVKNPTGATWEEENSRVTFYCPTALLQAIEADMARTGRSKTRVIVDTLQKALAGTSTPSR